MVNERELVCDAAADPDRLLALQALDILDTPGEYAFDRITELIRLIFGVEMGIVSMIDAHRQWYKSVMGLPTREAPLDGTFCRYTLQLGRPVIVPDARQDARFYDNPHVAGGPCIRFYAGAPITTATGEVIGTICAIDRQVREFGERETAILMHLAALVMRELELRQEASTDVLTGAASRRAFKQEAGRHLALAQRELSPLSCVAFDLDYFKHVNDSFGHAAGDQVLAGVVRAVQSGMRQTDIIGRLGGEEFTILLPHTDMEAAVAVAEKLRQIVKGLHFSLGAPQLEVSASFGVSSLAPGDDLESLLSRADLALYQAKKCGRDQVCRAATPNEPEKANRRRVLVAGQISSDAGRDAYDCTIKSVWDDGAEIAVSLPGAVPDRFNLLLRGAEEPRACVVTRRMPGSLEARFIEA